MIACPLKVPSQARSSLAFNQGGRPTDLAVKTVMYGVSYYPEYEPDGRLQEDIALMRRVGITTVGMGESTWSLWEPEDGKFEKSH
jgi:beta-galactosidase